MLEAERLTKCYSAVPAVQDVNFCLAPGQVLGCVGPNGSGKSTTVKMLTGLLEPTRGHGVFRGVDIGNDLVSYRRRLGHVPSLGSIRDRILLKVRRRGATSEQAVHECSAGESGTTSYGSIGALKLQL